MRTKEGGRESLLCARISLARAREGLQRRRCGYGMCMGIDIFYGFAVGEGRRTHLLSYVYEPRWRAVAGSMRGNCRGDWFYSVCVCWLFSFLGGARIFFPECLYLRAKGVSLKKRRYLAAEFEVSLKWWLSCISGIAKGKLWWKLL